MYRGLQFRVLGWHWNMKYLGIGHVGYNFLNFLHSEFLLHRLYLEFMYRYYI